MIIVDFFVLELMFLETSALTGENVEETFLKCARQILTKIESGNFLCHQQTESSSHFRSLI